MPLLPDLVPDCLAVTDLDLLPGLALFAALVPCCFCAYFLLYNPHLPVLLIWLQHRSGLACNLWHSCLPEPSSSLSPSSGVLGRRCKRSPFIYSVSARYIVLSQKGLPKPLISVSLDPPGCPSFWATTCVGTALKAVPTGSPSYCSSQTSLSSSSALQWSAW